MEQPRLSRPDASAAAVSPRPKSVGLDAFLFGGAACRGGAMTRKPVFVAARLA
jgi:hypothetical protein